jgi:D-psicose/D-tagatose/L-ribulose 3-epimerase
VNTRRTGQWPLYFSFFMFTIDLRPDDPEYRKVIIGHIHELTELGYVGFDLPIVPGPPGDHEREVEGYRELRTAFDEAGLQDIGITANVAATRRFDPTSPYKEQRDAALGYLKSRVEITAALGGDIMAGPIVFPYNVFPLSDTGEAIWSDQLHAWLIPGYRYAQPILGELASYAQDRGVKLAIEAVDHWETPAPNSVTEVMDFLDGIRSPQLGVCVDTAHVMLGGGGPNSFSAEIRRCGEARRLHYVHISAPDRGLVHDSWIPWKAFLEPILDYYDGPLLIETFNAIPVFHAPLRLCRRKFWVPGEDTPDPDIPDAYTVAREALAAVSNELSSLEGATATIGAREHG